MGGGDIRNTKRLERIIDWFWTDRTVLVAARCSLNKIAIYQLG
ncbi:hypothetical protein GCM10010320_81880 [Streptomyces caelestis]|nr:hypothetical protein GCM10010320_81880 [Streptomyces caelestis]